MCNIAFAILLAFLLVALSLPVLATDEEDGLEGGGSEGHVSIMGADGRPVTRDCRSKELPIVNCGEGKIFIDPNLANQQIEQYSFEKAFITEVSIPNTIIAIGNAAFHQNKLLSRITIPSSVKYIGHSSFKNCILANVDFSVANSLESIGNRAFQNNNLKRIEIPASVKSIGDYAFVMNPLEFACYLGDESPKLGADVFPERIELIPCIKTDSIDL